MKIRRLDSDKALVILRRDEIPNGSDALSMNNPCFRLLLRRAVRSAFLPPPPRIIAEAYPLAEGAALVLCPERTGSCRLALRFPDAAAASAVIEDIAKRYSPLFVPHADGSLTLLMRLPCADAERLALRTWDFCIAEYPDEARTAYLREWAKPASSRL